MGGMPNMGGMGGMPNMGGMPGMGGFGGGGGGQQHQKNRGGGGQQRQQQGRGGQHQRHPQQEQQPQESPTVYTKDDPSGVVPLGKSRFPDTRAKHAWLMLFYDRDSFEHDATTKSYVSQAKQISEGVLKKAKNVKNGMIFKVGAVDCSGGSAADQFCQKKLGEDVELPAFATVLNGSVNVITDKAALRTAKKLHDHTTDALLKIEGLIVNVNSVQHIQSRLLASSPAPGHPSIAILLFTDKYETSPLYASLAYRHRHDGFAAFGESRGGNLQLGKRFGVKKYPMLVAFVGSAEKVVQYDGGSLDLESLSEWLEGLSKKHFKDGRKKKKKVRS
mmetsp:Transcript_135/g.306  ORF Transcript_135/g.306 Transcript_135/m.306 type:complete len:332 (-) Transcript_135:154-1149(-)